MEKFPRILVVDDEPINIEVMSSMLTAKKLKNDEARCGLAAIEIIKKRLTQVQSGEAPHFYKILILDYSMPDITGVEVATKVITLI